ncbi:MAG: hypothetical protein GC202_02025 [Alphaproteobacteria bacterium]|nr:hypothetical protein [Alphaproteobacteria bacterium]
MGVFSLVFGLVTGPKRWLVLAIAAAIVAAAVAGYIGWLKWSIADLERDLAVTRSDLKTARENVLTAVRVNERNLVEVDRLRDDSAAVRHAVGGELAAAAARCAASIRIKREVARVATESPAQCPVAPSVRAALRGLQPDDARSPDRDADRARGGPPAR